MTENTKGITSSNLSYSWADMCDDSETELPMPNTSFAEVNIKEVNDIGKDTNEKFIEKQEEIKKVIEVKETPFQNDKIIDKPENLNTLYVERENEYKTLKTESNHVDTNWRKSNEQKWQIVQKNKKKAKCYTCFPRKKVLEHVIQKDQFTTFHHDMCNRNIIVVTPNKHFSNLEYVTDDNIGKLFKAVHKFCKDWNIKDYSVIYNQGDWQTHSHFHLKIKTHDNIIKRLKGDHWRRQKLINERNKTNNAVHKNK